MLVDAVAGYAPAGLPELDVAAVSQRRVMTLLRIAQALGQAEHVSDETVHN